jgi:23S rRNA (adenine2030-N6)-methyltransferase
VPGLAADYLAVVRGHNPRGRLDVYPGSPRFARHLLRAQDRMLLCELNTIDHALLREEFRGDAQVAVHLQDAWQALKAFLPPKERRGLVLIDPAYEQREEYQRLVAGLKMAYQRWPTGSYAIWYPLMSTRQAEELYRRVGNTGIRKIMRVELTVAPLRPQMAMCGSGLLIVNPPWPLQEEIAAVLPWLWDCLSTAGGGGTRVEWLMPE